MAQIQTYPRKSSYNGNDLFLVADKTPNAQGKITNETKSVTLSTVVAAAITESTPIALNLTTQGTSGAAQFNSVTSTLNIPVYTTDTNTTYSLGTGATPGIIALTGSDGTVDNVTIQGTGGISINQFTSGTFVVDGSGISGGVAQVTAASPAASTGAPLVVSPTTGNVTVQSKAYAGGSNIGHVPTGGTATTFLRGDGNFSTVVTSTPAFSPSPIYTGGAGTPIGTQQTYLFQWYSTVKMSPTKIKLFFPSADGEDISVALYNGTIDPLDANLYASKINHNVGSTDGIQEFTLTQESGVGDIVVGQAIALVISIKGRGGSDTLLVGPQAMLDSKIAQVSTTENYISSAFPANINSFTTGFGNTKVRPAFFLY